MKLTNQQIYSYAEQLSAFNIEVRLPIKVNFFLQKNIQTLMALAQEIEQARLGIAQHYGDINEEGNGYIVPPDRISEAQQELTDLLSLEQEVNIHTFKIEDFGNIELSFQELSNIMFMIEE